MKISAFTKLYELPVSIKALIVTQLILTFKIGFESYLGDVIDSVLVASIAHDAELSEERIGNTLKNDTHFFITLVACRLSGRRR